jgi:hypothetical protein
MYHNIVLKDDEREREILPRILVQSVCNIVRRRNEGFFPWTLALAQGDVLSTKHSPVKEYHPQYEIQQGQQQRGAETEGDLG